MSREAQMLDPATSRFWRGFVLASAVSGLFWGGLIVAVLAALGER